MANKGRAKLIADTAVNLFKKRGYANVSVNDICVECGVARSTFYSLFNGKDSIVAYILKNLKTDFSSNLSSFISAENDFERMMLLFNYYVDIGEEYGWELIASLFKTELDNSIGIFDSIHVFDDWFVELIKNCQASGIMQNRTEAKLLMQLGMQLAIAREFEWCRAKGSFPLRQTMRLDMEILYDILPEYRKSPESV